MVYDFSNTSFRIKPVTKLGKLMQEFCRMKNLQFGEVRFLYDSQRIKEDDTVESLGIKDDDIIDALTQQTGG